MLMYCPKCKCESSSLLFQWQPDVWVCFSCANKIFVETAEENQKLISIINRHTRCPHCGQENLTSDTRKKIDER